MSDIPNLASVIDVSASHPEDFGAAEIWAAFEEQLRPVGLCSVHYESGMPMDGNAELCLKSIRSERHAFGDLISPDFMVAVRDNPEFHKADAFVRHCEQSVLPLVYDTARSDRLPARMHGINDLARDFGVTGGVIVPLRGFREPSFGNVTFMLDQHSPMHPEALPVAELTAIAHVIHGKLTDLARISSPTTRRRPRLTQREISCMTYVANGLSTKRLSHLIGISDATANEHIRNACRKLHATTRAEAAARAVSLGLINL